jgi:hypothetical protein
MSLTMVVAAPFRFSRKERLKKNEIVYFLVYDRRWMSLDQANLLIARALEERLLEYEGEMLHPLFEISTVQIPIGYKPSSGILEPHDPVSELIGRIARDAGISPVQVTSEMNALIKDGFDEQIRPEAAVVILARKYRTRTSDLLASLEASLLKNR